MSTQQAAVFILTLFAIAAGLVAGQQDTANARLVVDKEIFNKYIVEGRDIVVNYHLINVGGQPARDIIVTDDSFSPKKFTIVNGLVNFEIPEIAPGTNITHSVIVRPKPESWGQYKFASARVSYILNESGQKQVGYSSELGSAHIVPDRTFDRKFSSQFFDWVVFALLCVPSIYGPYYLWNASNSKWAALAAKQSAKAA